MRIERGEKEIRWTYLFASYSIPLLSDTEFIYSSKYKLIYVRNTVNNQLQISVYSIRGQLVDQRTYSHYFVNFYEKDGFACMKYYDYGMQSYCTATFLNNAGISSISRAQ